MSMNCKYCGNPIDADDLFCTGCGKKIEENFNAYTQKTQGYVPQQEEEITPEPETPQQQQAPQPEQTQQAPPPEQQQTQQAPPRASYVVNQPSKNEPLTLGKCILGLVLLCIPFVNIVCLFVWAFSGNANTNIQNIARTLLIAGVLCIALVIGGFANFLFRFDTFTDFPTETMEEVAPTMPWERLDLLFDVSEL